MANVLITGATGNVGSTVISALVSLPHHLNLFAGVRNISESAKTGDYNNVKPVSFDFTDPANAKNALQHCDILFLLRPPQLSEVNKYFKPIVDGCVETGVKHIVFLSVQGVEKSKIIPHHKIEKLITDSKIPYTFLRPAYFMQNFTTTLHADLVSKNCIYLPAGNAKFTLIDVRDIGLVAAKIITNTAAHINKSYELTCNQKLSFTEMAALLTKGLGIPVRFISPDLFRFFITKRREKIPVMLILVMIMLHYLPRFQKEPLITGWVKKLTGSDPVTFQQFIHDNKSLLIK
jgi:uncharacterized protein YbjT (DUF2867 family)